MRVVQDGDAVIAPQQVDLLGLVNHRLLFPIFGNGNQRVGPFCAGDNFITVQRQRDPLDGRFGVYRRFRVGGRFRIDRICRRLWCFRCFRLVVVRGVVRPVNRHREKPETH